MNAAGHKEGLGTDLSNGIGDSVPASLPSQPAFNFKEKARS